MRSTNTGSQPHLYCFLITWHESHEVGIVPLHSFSFHFSSLTDVQTQDLLAHSKHTATNIPTEAPASGSEATSSAIYTKTPRLFLANSHSHTEVHAVLHDLSGLKVLFPKILFVGLTSWQVEVVSQLLHTQIRTKFDRKSHDRMEKQGCIKNWGYHQTSHNITTSPTGPHRSGNKASCVDIDNVFSLLLFKCHVMLFYYENVKSQRRKTTLKLNVRSTWNLLELSH